jgi:hypothetical protein
MYAERHRIPHMRYADVYADFYVDLYIRLNFMKFKSLVCILNINIYNSALTLNKYKIWCGGVTLGQPPRGMGFEFHLLQYIFLRILKYSNWLDLLWRLDPCKLLCGGSKGLDMEFSMAKNPHINLVAFIDPHTHMRRTEPHFNTMVLIEDNTFF